MFIPLIFDNRSLFVQVMAQRPEGDNPLSKKLSQLSTLIIFTFQMF